MFAKADEIVSEHPQVLIGDFEMFGLAQVSTDRRRN
jgi:hypothetical protein